MTTLKRSAPTLLYAGVSALAFGAAAALVIQAEPAVEPTTAAEKECHAILKNEKTANAFQIAGCLHRNIIPFNLR